MDKDNDTERFYQKNKSPRWTKNNQFIVRNRKSVKLR